MPAQDSDVSDGSVCCVEAETFLWALKHHVDETSRGEGREWATWSCYSNHIQQLFLETFNDQTQLLIHKQTSPPVNNLCIWDYRGEQHQTETGPLATDMNRWNMRAFIAVYLIQILNTRLIEGTGIIMTSSPYKIYAHHRLLILYIPTFYFNALCLQQRVISGVLNEQGESISGRTFKTGLHCVQKETPPMHMVLVLQAPPLLLLSTQTVILYTPFSTSCVKSRRSLQWSNSAPYCPKLVVSVILLQSFCFVRSKELTHNPFIAQENSRNTSP